MVAATTMIIAALKNELLRNIPFLLELIFAKLAKPAIKQIGCLIVAFTNSHAEFVSASTQY
jgi:hypothetical protein